MQRIIGYECFLENTINNLCEQLGVKKKLLGVNTNFITEAMKDKKPGIKCNFMYSSLSNFEPSQYLV